MAEIGRHQGRSSKLCSKGNRKGCKYLLAIGLFSPPGKKLRMGLCKTIIAAVAQKESWNPTSNRSIGLTSSNRNPAIPRVFRPSPSLPLNIPRIITEPMVDTRRTEAGSPVTSASSARAATVHQAVTDLPAPTVLSKKKTTDAIRPTWSTETAST